MSKPKIIAFYLPQYYPTPHNDEWWGKGFTEWTNVARAKKLFPGHYQPKIPADLGFYDLRLPEIREQQAQLAREAGIEGFCYYEYWFGDGHEELELPFSEVVDSGKPNFPFCLCWANESWKKKSWSKDGAVFDSKLLAEQTYPGEQDIVNHFNARLKAFKDQRYMKYEGRLIYMIYRPLDYPGVQTFMDTWQRLAKENGLPGFYFLGFEFLPELHGAEILQKGFDAIVSCRNSKDHIPSIWSIIRRSSFIINIPRINPYKKMWPRLVTELEKKDDKYIPVLMPNWDHTPRSGARGDLFQGATPEEFGKHCMDVLTAVVKKKNPLCFIKSWNEWGEGNYMEPDLKYGKGYINALRNVIDHLHDTNSD